jgi:hypothetical protein
VHLYFPPFLFLFDLFVLIMDGVVDISELPAPTRRRAPSFYVVLFFLVVPFWAAIPLAWTFVIYSLHTGRLWTYATKGQTIFVLALAEVGVPLYASFYLS